MWPMGLLLSVQKFPIENFFVGDENRKTEISGIAGEVPGF